jgi:hypothetical protein
MMEAAGMHRSGRLKVLTDIEAAMRREQGVGSLLTSLSDLLQAAETAVEQDSPGAEGMNEIAGYVARIRHLLDNLRPELYHPAVAEESRILAARYRDLEGRVMELRNARAGEMR